LKRTCRHFFALWLIVAAIFAQANVFSQERTSGSAAALVGGFGAEESAAERRLEEQYRAVPQADSARSHLQRLTREAHVAGTREDYETAVYVRDRMRAYGLAAELKEYQVLLPYPKQPSIVELIAPRRERLKVQEAVVAQDSTSSSRKIIPLFNGYSASGDVTAPLVYVNYGLPNDYEALAKLGVEVKGRIAIARYGNSFRGVKAKVAEQHGAVGLIIYSDPADDGYAQGDVYPAGPWRPESSAQRGSVEYIFEYPGDPLTPGLPSTPGTPRIKQEDAVNLTHIPVQPISYGDARRLLEPLRGPLRPKEFQGGLPFAYHVGGTTEVRAHLKTEMDYATRTIWNVVARIDGETEPERWVVMGNHRDAWVFGAVDPNSGTTAMLEAARGFGQLLKAGWKPRRTILLCSWDAEEYGLIGSTEWAEELAAELREKAVAYLNMDAAVSGANFGASSVPSLWQLIRGAARDVRDPKSGQSLYDAWQAHSREQRPASAMTANSGAQTPVAEARIGALGSGSDYTPFLQRLGVPALDMGFNGDYGVYHSAFDSFYWMSKFGDPTFQYHVAAAQIWGVIALRLANAEGLPLVYTAYAAQIGDFLSDIERAAASHNLADSFDAKALREAIDDFSDEAGKLEARKQSLIEEAGKTRAQGNDSYARAVARLRRLNDALIAAERALTDERGLRGRSWYRHQIYAPGYYTGYAAQPLPDLRQAIDDNRAPDAREAAARITEALKRATEVLKKGRE
jgi:N-acetylated-alpha-linked acidic dipeptidase